MPKTIDDDGLPHTVAELDSFINTTVSEMKHVESDIQDEEAVRKRWKAENARRRHNYVPFIFNLLEKLADKGALKPLLEAGEKATAEKKAAAERAKAASSAAKKAT